MPDDLRARITEALNTTPAGFVQASPDAVAFHYEHEWNRHDKHQYMGSCALCRGEADTLTDALMAVVVAELDTERLDRCPRCLCSDCGGRLDEHTEDDCTCKPCAQIPRLACRLAEFAPDERIGFIAEQLAPLLSSHLNERARLRCLVVAHAAHHALYDYDTKERSR